MRVYQMEICFQFPLSERTNCNSTNKSVKLVPSVTFSFLYRNERTATITFRRRKRVNNSFQFPLSERTNCNIVSICKKPAVSSKAFSFLYRNERTATNNVIISILGNILLSVSSIGTNELQPIKTLKTPYSSSAFSFLYRNERTATTARSPPQSPADSPFSFLYRNERTATSPPRADTLPHIPTFSFLYRNERTATAKKLSHKTFS